MNSVPQREKQETWEKEIFRYNNKDTNTEM